MRKDEKKILKNNPKVDLKQLVFNMIEEFPKKSKDIIIKRFGLDKNGETNTLEKIGKEYKITRERVRQIEFETISKLRNTGEKYGITQVFKNIRNSIENYGGIAGEGKIVDCLFDKGDEGKTNRQVTLFILSLDDKIKKINETKAHKKLYFYEEEKIERFKNIIRKIEKHLEKNGKDLNFSEMLKIASEDIKSEETFSSFYLKSYLSENKIILRNILGRWGHTKWPQINPKSVKGKAYLTLKKNEKPLHFVEIANKINKLWRGDRIANSQTTHNELIKDDRFVLIGRGIYALREWGYTHGTVSDVITGILKENDGKMERSEITREVLKRRQVKKNTITLNLQNKEYFEKLEKNMYRLR